MENLFGSVAMIRAFFLACGTFVCLCGGLLLLVDQIVLTDEAGRQLRATAELPGDHAGEAVIDPPDWGAFGLLSIGGVTLLYSLALPGRRSDDEDDNDDEPFLQRR